MKITVLVENTSLNKDFRPEHGLSLYIETEHHKILFDMGQTSLFADNAKKLGIHLEDVDIAILSHGHYDHGGGLRRFLEINQKAPVYLSPYAFEAHFHGPEKYIGLDASLAESQRLICTGDTFSPTPNLTLYSCNHRRKSFELGSFGLSVKQKDTFLPDDFRHEQYLLIEENHKRVLFSGCSHKGILNIAGWFEPDVLVGGFHFSKLPADETLAGYARYLGGFPTAYYTCHCTGTAQFEFMKSYIDNLYYFSTGQSIVL